MNNINLRRARHRRPQGSSYRQTAFHLRRVMWHLYREYLDLAHEHYGDKKPVQTPAEYRTLEILKQTEYLEIQ
jgi:hypothetical protein